MSLIAVSLLVALLLLSILLHEMGHFLFAKRFKLATPELSVGFGPKIFSKIISGTQFSLRALPLGGYLQIDGMYKASTRNEARLIKLIREKNPLSQQDAATGKIAFWQLKPRKRFVVMVAGPSVNLFLGVLFSTVSVSLLGIPGVTNQVQDNGSTTTIETGSRVTKVDGKPVSSYDDIQQTLNAIPISSRNATLTFTTLDGTEKSASVPVHRLIINGVQETYSDLSFTEGAVRRTPTEAIAFVGQQIQKSLRSIPAMPAKTIQVASQTLIQGNERPSDAPSSIVTAARYVANQAETATSKEKGIAASLGTVFLIAAAINIFLFLFNLIPIPPLDGGYAAAAMIDWLRNLGDHAREPIDMARFSIVAYAFLGVTLLGSVTILATDILRPIQFN